VSSSSQLPSFLVAGAGAVGSGLGAMLRLAGCEVALLSRNRARMDAARASGIRMRGLWGERTAEGFTVFIEPVGLPAVDYVLVTTKSFDTAALVEAVARTQPDAQFVSFQNGLGNVEAIAATVGADRTIGGMIIIGFAVPAPGEVAVTVFGGDVLVGRPSAQPGAAADPAVARLAGTLTGAGVPTHATDGICGAIWGKVLYNCALNPLGAILGVPYGELSAPDTWAIIEDIVTEAFAVARADRVRLPWPDPQAYLKVLAEQQLPATARHRASMLQDIERGHRTEIEFLNGAVVGLGERRGVPAPVNAALTALVRHFEAHGAAREKT
jgi:2-dehydropantoate 2-reductase